MKLNNYWSSISKRTRRSEMIYLFTLLQREKPATMEKIFLKNGFQFCGRKRMTREPCQVGETISLFPSNQYKLSTCHIVAQRAYWLHGRTILSSWFMFEVWAYTSWTRGMCMRCARLKIHLFLVSPASRLWRRSRQRRRRQQRNCSRLISKDAHRRLVYVCDTVDGWWVNNSSVQFPILNAKKR